MKWMRLFLLVSILALAFLWSGCGRYEKMTEPNKKSEVMIVGGKYFLVWWFGPGIWKADLKKGNLVEMEVVKK